MSPKLRFFLLAIGSAVVAIGFQNCSKSNFAGNGQTSTSTSPTRRSENSSSLPGVQPSPQPSTEYCVDGGGNLNVKLENTIMTFNPSDRKLNTQIIIKNYNAFAVRFKAELLCNVEVTSPEYSGVKDLSDVLGYRYSGFPWSPDLEAVSDTPFTAHHNNFALNAGETRVINLSAPVPSNHQAVTFGCALGMINSDRTLDNLSKCYDGQVQ